MNRQAPAARAAISDPRVAAIVDWFENLAVGDLDRIDAVYADDAWFKDPFNEVRGSAAVAAVYRHMFESLQQPRFVICDVIVQRDQCFISWEFLFRMRRFSAADQTIRGASHLQLDAAGRIALHRDYWDAAEELYEKLPLVGMLMRWLRRRAST